MRIVPSETDRTILLLAILYSVAIFLPQAWLAMFGMEVEAANGYIAIFAVLVILSVASFGARRKIIAGLAACGAVAVAYVASNSRDLANLASDWTYRPNGQMKEIYGGQFYEGLTQLVILAAAMFATSFALSFAMDRFIGPVIGTEPREPETGNNEAREKSRGKVRLLIIIAACLFAVHFFVNGAGSRFGNRLSAGNVELFVSTLFVLGITGLYCRLSIWKSLIAIIVFSVAAAVTLIQWVSIRLEAEVSSILFAVMFVGTLLSQLLVFFLAARSSRDKMRLPGWLSIVAIALLAGGIWVNRSYDVGTLLFSPSRFDFDLARSVKKMRSHAGVEVQLQTTFAWRTSCRVTFTSQDGVDDFFNECAIPGIPIYLQINGMPETVDLSPLADPSLIFLAISFTDSAVSSQQLADIVSVQQVTGLQEVELSGCRFVPGAAEWPKKATGNFRLSRFKGEGANFVSATEGLDHLVVDTWDSGGDEDAAAIARAFKSRDGKFTFRSRGLWQLPANVLDTSCDLSGLSTHVDFESDTGRNAVIDLVLNSNANLSTSQPEDELFWDLLFAAKSRLMYYRDLDRDQPAIPDDLNEAILRKFNLIYDESSPGMPATKLYLPRLPSRAMKHLGKYPELESLSFDSTWCRTNVWHDPIDWPVDISTLNQLTKLKHLYLPRWERSLDIGSLTELSDLETLQVNTLTSGFNESLFPNLKHLIVVVVDRAEPGLLDRLGGGLTRVEKVTICGVANKQLEALVEKAYPNVQIESQVYRTIYEQSDAAPEDFKAHRERVRKRCVEKYLD